MMTTPSPFHKSLGGRRHGHLTFHGNPGKYAKLTLLGLYFLLLSRCLKTCLDLLKIILDSN